MINIYFYEEDSYREIYKGSGYCVYLIMNDFKSNFIQTDLFQINLNIAYKNTIIVIQKDLWLNYNLTPLWLNYNLTPSDKIFTYTIKKDDLLLLNKDLIVEFISELNLLYENKHRTYKRLNIDYGDTHTYYIIRNLISIINLNLYEH